MHVDNELVEFMSVGEQEYKEIIKEYEDQEGASEPSVADFADTPPAQGKLRFKTLILNDHWIYIYVCVCVCMCVCVCVLCIYVIGILWKLHA